MRKKFRNWKSKVKKKVSQANRGRNLTGGGEINYSLLDPLEQKLAHLTKEEVLGVKGGLEVGIEMQTPTGSPSLVIYIVLESI